MGSFLLAQMSVSAGYGFLGAGLGAGLVIIGAAAGIGKLAAAALESTARQPEVSGDLRVSMIIPAALIEGISLFALLICFLMPGSILEATQKEADAVSKKKDTTGQIEMQHKDEVKTADGRK